MKNVTIQNTSENVCRATDCYSQVSKEAFLLILNQKIIPLHWEIVKQSQYFEFLEKSQDKVYVLETAFDVNIFEQVLGFLYGKPISIVRGSQVRKLLEITRFLSIKGVEEKLEQDLLENLDDYGIFSGLEIALKYNFKRLQQKCLQELVDLDFEQIIINKFDLLYLEKNTFSYVLKEHSSLKQEKVIKGIKKGDLDNIIREYSEFNNVSMDLNIQSEGSQFNPEDVESQSESKTKRSSFKISKSVNQNESEEKASKKLNMLYKNKSQIHEIEVENEWEIKVREASNLKSENNRMIATSCLFKNQLADLKTQISESRSNSSTALEIQDLTLRCNELRELGSSQNQKIEKLRSSFSDFSEKLNKSQDRLSEDFFNCTFKKPRRSSAYEMAMRF